MRVRELLKASAVVLVIACGSQPVELPPPRVAFDSMALLSKVAVAFWTEPTSTVQNLNCQPAVPCDTLIVAPRVVALRGRNLDGGWEPDDGQAVIAYEEGLEVPGLHSGPVIRVGAWRECITGRDRPAWRRGRSACVALALTKTSGPGGGRQVALKLLTPALGERWFNVAGWEPPVSAP